MSLANLVYVVFAVGGAAIYFLLPRRYGHHPAVGLLLGVAALVAYAVVMLVRISVHDPTRVYFVLLSLLALGGATRVITHTKPVYSALYFILVIVSSAALLVLLQAEFLAVAVLIIYAGAILVTYLFVIMLAQQSGAPAYDRNAREPFGAVLAGFVLTAIIASSASESGFSRAVASAAPGQGAAVADHLQSSNTLDVGAALMTRYVVATQIGGILLLVSMIGAIALAKRRVPAEQLAHQPVVLGEVGKEVPPF